MSDDLDRAKATLVGMREAVALMKGDTVTLDRAEWEALRDKLLRYESGDNRMVKAFAQRLRVELQKCANGAAVAARVVRAEADKSRQHGREDAFRLVIDIIEQEAF